MVHQNADDGRTCMIIDSGYIFIDDLVIYAYHGVIDQERKVGSNFSVSVKVKTDITDAVMNDSINDAVDYAELYDIVKKEMAKPSALLENVAGRITQAIFDVYEDVLETTVKITKLSPPAMPGCSGAGVVVHAVNSR